MKTINKRRVNKIIMLKFEHGNWIEDENALKEMVNANYKKFFLANDTWCKWIETRINFP